MMRKKVPLRDRKINVERRQERSRERERDSMKEEN